MLFGFAHTLGSLTRSPVASALHEAPDGTASSASGRQRRFGARPTGRSSRQRLRAAAGHRPRRGSVGDRSKAERGSSFTARVRRYPDGVQASTGREGGRGSRGASAARRRRRRSRQACSRYHYQRDPRKARVKGELARIRSVTYARPNARIRISCCWRCIGSWIKARWVTHVDGLVVGRALTSDAGIEACLPERSVVAS